jgi:hypothetical protein
MHGEDVAVFSGHCVGLRRVSMQCDQLRLNQFIYKQANTKQRFWYRLNS